MMGKYLNLLTVFGLILHLSAVSVASAEATSNQHGCPGVSTALQIPFRACYIHEAKVAPLMAQVLAIVKTLNSQEDYAQHTGVQLQKLKLEELEMCANEEVRLLTEELVWITQRLWQLSNRLEKPADVQVQLLKTRKIDLLRHLRNMVVYTGDSAASGMQLTSFKAQVDLLEYGFDKVLTTFQTERPVRSNVTVDSIHAAIKIELELKKFRTTVLNPSLTAAELIEISKSEPEKMAEGLPQLISNWYAGTLENFNRTLQLVNSLPSVNLQVIGYAALYNEMRKASHLDTYEVTLLAGQLKDIRPTLDSAVVEQLFTQLVDDMQPLYKIFGQLIPCQILNVKYSLSLNSWNRVAILHRSNHTHKILPSGPSNRALVEIHNDVYSWRLYSSDSLTLSPVKRGVEFIESPPPALHTEWKLIPVQGGKYFKILNAHYNEVLYADKTEKDAAGWRRVLLAKNSYSGPPVYEEEEALWSLHCS